MYGSSYYGGSDVFSLLAAAGGVWVALSFLAFIASIVCTVLIYKRFVSSQGHQSSSASKHDFGPFIRFEKFWSEKILIVLFVYNMCSIAFECAACAIALLFAIAYSPSGAIMGIFAVAILFVIGEVLNRLFFEFFMLIVKMWRNTQEIRVAVSGESVDGLKTQNTEPTSVDGGFTYSGKTVASSAAETKPMSANGISQASDAWVCPSCGAANKTGMFCAQCGKRRS